MYREVKFNKFGAQRKDYNGRSYHSLFEANYAAHLDLLKMAGEILDWIPQYKIDLRVNGKHIVNYYMDFKVITKHGAVEFHETKGAETDTWRMKWLILEATKDEIEPGVELVLVKQSNNFKKNTLGKKLVFNRKKL